MTSPATLALTTLPRLGNRSCLAAWLPRSMHYCILSFKLDHNSPSGLHKVLWKPGFLGLESGAQETSEWTILRKMCGGSEGRKGKPSQERSQLVSQSPHRELWNRCHSKSSKNCCEGGDPVMGLQLVCQMDGLDIGIPYSPSYYSDHCKHVGEMLRTRTRYTNATKKISCCFLFTFLFWCFVVVVLARYITIIL